MSALNHSGQGASRSGCPPYPPKPPGT